MKTAVAYLRWSTDRQDLSAEAQRAAIEKWALVNGVAVASWHEDAGVSGGTPVEERPGLLAAVASIDESDADFLVVAKRDRLARDVFAAAMVERLCQKKGARVQAAEGANNEDTPEGALMRTIVDAFAEFERALIRSRTRAALAVKRAREEKTGGDVPYGKRLAADGVHLETDHAEMQTVLYARFSRAMGASLRSIAAALTANGHVPRSGGAWLPQTVARMCAAAT